VVPVLPPSPEPPPNRAQLPVAAYDPTPAPAPPPPSTWRERLLDSLATTTPRQPLGALMPSARNLARVAAADARLHDEATETRLIEDHGPFFRRGLEALRGNWHPDEVLRRQHDDAVRRCGHENRMTYAVAVIDGDGNVVDVDLKGSSGCAPLDVEAVRAFRRVARFPHPPQALFVDGEGAPAATARLPVRFLVSFDGGLQVDWR
jgi:TonB family protein